MHECNANVNPNEKHFRSREIERISTRTMSDILTESESLHPHSFRRKLGIGVSIRINPNLSSIIDIKVKNLYQFMNKCHRILCFWHRHFLFGCLQLKAIWLCMPNSTIEMTKPLRYVLFLASKLIGILRFLLI